MHFYQNEMTKKKKKKQNKTKGTKVKFQKLGFH